MPWWEKLLFYVGQGQYNQAVSNVHQAEATVQGAKWLWGALQGDFNKNPTTGQVIVGGIISLIPLVDQACDVRDVIANCITLSDEEARKDNENWIALGLTCIGFVPEFGSAIKTVAKVAIKKGTVLLDLLKQMEWIERNFQRLKAGCPWARAPIDWLRKFDWQKAAQEAAAYARRAFASAQAKAAAAAKYAIGAIQAKLQQLADLFKLIVDKIAGVLSEVAQRIKARVDEMLKTKKKQAGNYDATPGDKPNLHTQDEVQPPKGPPPRKPTRMGPHRPKCFKPGDDLRKNWKGDPRKLEKEFYEQLKGQEAGLNKLTVKEYLDNRARYAQVKRAGTGEAQELARDRLFDDIQRSINESNRRAGMGPAEAERRAKERASEIMESLAALHEPDMVAGGSDPGGSGSKPLPLGSSQVNSSIGSQWSKGNRLAEMDKAAQEAMAQHGPDAKMNVTLERCPH
ncbi:hypothetical protein HLB44_20795 [Aquincola sp. S2]|uniref:Novel toxin 15 domain-containing protein n=1 Tax=Pseudaquabacterium terrae TaxID=2732868 RepID=A0ABX2ELG3_9BURK|nr:polymorphic toxin type 15 domain-containing protein [Aquabacterium terrae]NRF69443.1 hypothetical protein [Aquabacterium terrae]